MTKKQKTAEPLTASVAPAPSIEDLNDGKLWIPVKEIVVTGENPRLHFDESEMQDLIASVKSMGITTFGIHSSAAARQWTSSSTYPGVLSSTRPARR